MDAVTVITSLLTLLAGVGVFLTACGIMSANLEALGSKKLKALFSKASKNKLLGVGVGTVATAAIQSSSATTVMVIGFVNAGIMTLTQAATVIFGANIGTTITGQIVALGMFGGKGVSASVIFSALAGVGAFTSSFAKKDGVQKAGGILAGFGMIFVGLTVMSDCMRSFSELEEVRNFLAAFENPLLLLIVGVLLTALVQSSSVMTSMTITMVVTGLITLEQGIYVTLGSNVGTCVTALIAGLSGGANAKRAALLHLIFNAGGAVIFLIAGLLLRLGGTGYGKIFGAVFPNAPQTQLAMFHTFFNLVTVLAVLPLTGALVKLVTKLVPEKKTRPRALQRFYFIDEHMLATPPLAVNQVKNEITNMAYIAEQNFSAACEMSCTLEFGGLEKFRANERELDFLNRELVAFIAKLMKSRLGDRDRAYLSAALRTVSDLERVGDYAENITEYAEKLAAANERFSEDAVSEIRNIAALIKRLFEQTVKAYKDGDAAALKRACETEDEVDRAAAAMTENHIRRLGGGLCTATVGAHFLALSSNAERVADHFMNVAKTVRRA